MEYYSAIKKDWDFPGGPVVEHPPASAGGHRFDPWSGKMPHAMEQLSLCTTATEPTHLETTLHSNRNHHNEKLMHCR